MYEAYYGFDQPPFSLTPDPRFLYRSESHDIALQQVWQAIRRKEGFIVLTGDIGTGKTTLCRTILEQFDPTTFTSLVLNPFLSVEELLREVLLSYGVATKETLRTGRLSTATKHELVRTLHDFLLSLVPLHSSAVLIIDEAQHLTPDVLEEIRILSNLETNDRKLLQIVIVGQLNLLDLLRDARLRQLDQRVSVRCLLQPLNREEVEAYITHRLWVARGSTAVTFTPKAIDLVHAISGGVPRMINLICDRALMAGCQARTDKIAHPLIIDATSKLGLTVPRAVQRRGVGDWISPRGVAWTAAVLLVTLAGLLAYVVWTAGGVATLSSDPPPPAVTRAPTLSLPAPATLRPPPDTPSPLAAPPIDEGEFSVIVGTYDQPRPAMTAEAALRSQKFLVYAIDFSAADGAVRRRLLVGRYTRREQAEAVQKMLAPSFPEARVVPGVLERVP